MEDKQGGEVTGAGGRHKQGNGGGRLQQGAEAGGGQRAGTDMRVQAAGFRYWVGGHMAEGDGGAREGGLPFVPASTFPVIAGGRGGSNLR